MQSSKLPQRFKQKESRCVFSGCQGSAIPLETTLQIERPRIPRAQARRTTSAHYSRGRAHASAAIALISGGMNGGHPTKVVTPRNIDRTLASNLHEEAIWESAQEPSVPVDRRPIMKNSIKKLDLIFKSANANSGSLHSARRLEEGRNHCGSYGRLRDSSGLTLESIPFRLPVVYGPIQISGSYRSTQFREL
jgi:hypothetical protein